MPTLTADEIMKKYPSGLNTEQELKSAMLKDPDLYDYVQAHINEFGKPPTSDTAQLAAQPAADPAATEPAKEPAAPATGDKGSEDKGGTAPAPAAPAATPPEEKVIFEMPKSEFMELMGTYAKNREPREALVELVKGAKEKDRTIEFHRNVRNRQLETQLEEAQGEIVRLKSPHPAAPTAPAPAKTIETETGKKYELPALPEIFPEPEPLSGEDFLDEEKRNKFNDDDKKFKKSFREYAVASSKRQEILAKMLSDNTREIVDEKIAKEIKPVVDNLTAKSRQEELIASTNTELGEIEYFRSQHQDILGGDREIIEIENDYIDLLKNLGEHLNIANGIYKPNSNVVKKEILDALTEYQDGQSEKGKALVEAMKLRGAQLPEDIDVLFKIYRIREFRSKYPERGEDGKLRSLPLEKALRFAAQEYPELDENQARITAKADKDAKLREVAARADEEKNRKGKPGEPDPAKVRTDLDAANVTQAEFEAILAKPAKDRNDMEKNTLRTIQRFYELKDDEVKKMWDLE